MDSSFRWKDKLRKVSGCQVGTPDSTLTRYEKRFTWKRFSPIGYWGKPIVLSGGFGRTDLGLDNWLVNSLLQGGGDGIYPAGYLIGFGFVFLEKPGKAKYSPPPLAIG